MTSLRHRELLTAPSLLSAIFFPCFAAAEEGKTKASATYIADLYSNIDGGIGHGSAFLGKADLSLEIGTDVTHVEGLSAFINVQHVHGRALSADLVGDGQGVSNIEAVSALRPLEAWARMSFADDQAAIKIGLIDLNSEFDVQQVGQHFINSSHGIGAEFAQSGLNGPSIFPTTSTAIVLSYGRSPGFAVRLGVFDSVSGDPDRPHVTRIRVPGSTGALIVGELDFEIADAARFRVGGWAHTNPFDALTERAADGSITRLRSSRGAYALVETPPAGSGSHPVVEGWARIGIANDRVNAIRASLGGGITYGTTESKWGFAISHARLGKPVRASLPGQAKPFYKAETNVEVTYAIALSEQIIVQPDLQYIINPGWVVGRNDAFVLGVRLHFSLF